MTDRRDPLEDFEPETPIERNERERGERVQKIIDETRAHLREKKS